jgi:hypothetical protein
VDACHYVGTVSFYKYWPLSLFSPAVGKCDNSQRNRLNYFITKPRLVAFERLLNTWQSDKWLRVGSQYYSVRRVTKRGRDRSDQTNIWQAHLTLHSGALAKCSSRQTTRGTSMATTQSALAKYTGRGNEALHYCFFLFFWCDSPPVGQGLLIHKVSRSHTTTRHSR